MWNYVLYTDQTNVEMFGKKQTAYQHKRPIPTIKAQDLGTLQALIQPWAPLYTKVKRESICLTAKAWGKLSHVIGQRSQAQRQIYNRMAEQISQSPYLSMTKMLWQDLRRVVDKLIPTNINELKQSVSKVWVRIPPE